MSGSEIEFSQSHAATYDPGLTQKYTGTVSRIIAQNGNFNVRRMGHHTWRDSNPYAFLISTSWLNFYLIVATMFVVINVTFAGLYMAIGIDHIKGVAMNDVTNEFVTVFFFSTHTLTTVGYGNMYPDGPLANAIAAGEALVGLMGFAIATGLLFGRFSRPSVRFGFSQTMAVAPYQGETSLQFRVVNRRKNDLIEVEARVLLMTVEFINGKQERKYVLLDLERPQVLFLALTWTVVHPIGRNSPLYGKTREDFERLQAEILVLMRGYDETFGQAVYSRKSYRYDEIRWGVKFVSAFDVDQQGNLQLWIDKVGLTEPSPLPESQVDG